MEVEVTSFLCSLTANLKKFDIDAHSQTLLTAGGDWIETFQKQLSAGYWIEASLDRQLSILYVLNAYLKEAFRKRDDVDVWLTTIDMMLSNLHIKDSFHEKEVKHVLKLVTIWGNKEKEPKGKGQSNKRRLSIFPTEHCEKWLAAITERALKCGIRLNSTSNEAEVINTDQIPLSRPAVEVTATTKSVQSSSSVSKFPTTSATNKHPAYTTSTLSVPIIPALPTTSSASLSYTDDTNHKFIQVVCKFQMQVFQSFACHATRRLDRWNMNIVMLSSFHLLHLYFQEYGAMDASPAPLVVACIYLSGKSEYLFVKADKLRQVANKYVRDLNDPVMDSNLQVYKYEAQLLRMLQYNVGSIPNPLRILKALDILEANSQSPPGVPASLDPITPSNATSSSNNVSSVVHDNTATAMTTADTLNVAITATLGTTTDATSSTVASSVTSPPPIVVSLKNAGLSQARRLIDDAAAVFVKEEYLFNLNTHDLILSEQDFYLASAALLEKTHVAFSDVDLHECERKSSKFLHQLNELSPSLRQNHVLAVSTSSYNAKSGTASAPSRFMSLLLSLRLPKEPKPPADLSQMEEGEVLTSDTNSSDPLIDSSNSSALSESTVRNGTALFSVSAGCIELVNRVLPRVKREIYETSAVKARAGTAVPSVPPMPIAPVLAGPVQTLLSRQTAPAYPVHPSRSGLIASGQTSSSSAGINGGARDTYSASSDNRGEKRSRGRSRSPPREDNKKRRWDTYAEPDRDTARHSQGDHRSDHRESRDQSDRPRRDREDSRERRRRAEIEAQAVEDAFLMDYDSSKRSRKEQSPHQDRSKSRGHGHQRTPPYDHHRDSHQRDAQQSRDHRRREDSRDRARHRPRSPLVPPPPPRIPPPPPIPAPPSIPDVPRTMPGSSHKRPRSNSRSPGRHRNYAPLPPYPSVQPPPPLRSSYGSREEYQESSRSSRDNKKVSLTAPLSHSRSVHTSKKTVELEDGEEGELMEDGEINSVDADNSNYCQFIGTSTGNNTGASSAQVSSAPTPFLASAPSAPRVGLTQSMSQSWMPNDEEDGNEVVFLSPPAPVVDLTSGSPFVNTSSILPMPNIAKLTQFLAGRSAASNSSATDRENLPRAPPVLVVPPVLTVPAVSAGITAPVLPAPVSVPIIPLVPVEPTSTVIPDVVDAVPALAQSSAAPVVSGELTSCTSTENTALSAPVTAPLLVEAQSPKSEGSNTSTAAAEVAQTGEGSIPGSTSVHFNPSPSVSVSAASIEGNVSCVKPEVKFVEGEVQDVSAVPAEALCEEENEDGEVVETTAAKTLPATMNSATAAGAIGVSSTTATPTASIITPVSLTTTNSSALTTEPKSRFVTIPKMLPKWQREQQEATTIKEVFVESKAKNGGNKSAPNKGSANNNTGGAKDNHDPGHSKHGKNNDNSDRNKHDRGANRNDNSAFASASSHQSNKHHSNDSGNRNVSPSNQNREIKKKTSSEHSNTANLAPNDARHIILHSQAVHASRAGSDTTNNHRGSSNAHNQKGHRNNSTGTDTGSSTSSSSGSNGKNSNPEDKKARTFGFIRSILANPEGSRIRK